MTSTAGMKAHQAKLISTGNGRAPNNLLRDMEPPRHDTFEPDWLPTKDEKRKGKKALDDLAEWIRSVLKKVAKDPVSEVTSIDELKDLFGDEGNGEGGKGMEEINPYGEILIRAKPLKPKGTTSNYVTIDAIEGDSETDGDDTGDEEGGVGGGGDTGQGGGDGGGGKGKVPDGGTGGGQQPQGGDVVKISEVNNVRAILLGPKQRKIAFTPISSGTVRIHVQEAGADWDVPTSIIKSSQGTLISGGVALQVKAGERVNLDVDLDVDFTGALKVVAYEV